MDDSGNITAQDPDGVEEGYRIYREWADAMARSGQPLPPGGDFVLSRARAVSGALSDARDDVCRRFDIDKDMVPVAMAKEGDKINIIVSVSEELRVGDDETFKSWVDGISSEIRRTAQAEANAVMAVFDATSRDDLSPSRVIAFEAEE